MALAPDQAKRLWDSRYREELKNYAYKYRNLHQDNDPDDLFQDMVIHVWMKSVNTFDPAAVTFTENWDRAFNSYFTQWLERYLANLTARYNTGKQTFFREKPVSIFRSVSPKSSPEGKERLIDRIVNEKNTDPDVLLDLEVLYNRLPDNLSGPLKYIVDNLDSGNTNRVMQDVRDKWGWTYTRLYYALMDEPDFVEFAMDL